MIFNMVGGGGGSGATLVVSSPVNVSVTVSKDDKSYTKNSGSLGSTTFKGLATGTWTVTISGNGQTATRTIEITADYAITITFFSAFINITYPATSTCVVTDSSGQTVASDTNTTSSTKTFTATVNATGTYTVTATATDGSGNTKSESVEITSEGQSVSVTLSYTVFVFKENYGIGDDIVLMDSVVGTGLTNSDLPYTTSDVEFLFDKIKANTTMLGNDYWPNEKIYMDGYNTLCVELKCTGRYSQINWFKIGVGEDAPNREYYGSFVASQDNIYETSRTIIRVDISNVVGAFFVKVCAWGVTHEIYNIWLE